MNIDIHDSGSISYHTDDGRRFFANKTAIGYALIEVVAGGCAGIGMIKNADAIELAINNWLENHPEEPESDLVI